MSGGTLRKEDGLLNPRGNGVERAIRRFACHQAMTWHMERVRNRAKFTVIGNVR